MSETRRRCESPKPTKPTTSTNPSMSETRRPGWKDLDSEELVDYFLHRPPANKVVQMLLKLPFTITPNAITLTNLFVGLVSTSFMLDAFVQYPYNNQYSAWICAGLMYLGCTLDCCDGQMARILKMSSPFGRFLDGICDSIVITAYSVVLCYASLTKLGDVWYWLAVTATISVQQHAMIFDKIKIVYTLQAKPKTDATSVEYQEVTDLKLMRKKCEGCTNPIKAAMMKFACAYSEGLGIDPKLCEPGTLEGDTERRPHCQWTMRLTSFLGLAMCMFIWYCMMIVYPFAPVPILKVFIAFHVSVGNVYHLFVRGQAIKHGLYHGAWSELQATTYFYGLGLVVYFATKAGII